MLYSEKKHPALAFACRECRRRTHNHWFLSSVIRICCRTSKTVDFARMRESGKHTARVAFWISQPCDSVSRSKQTNELTRMQATTKSMAKYDIIKAWSCLECVSRSEYHFSKTQTSSRVFSLRLQLRVSSYKFGVPFTQALIVEHLMRTQRAKITRRTRDSWMCCGCRFITRRTQMYFG